MCSWQRIRKKIRARQYGFSKLLTRQSDFWWYFLWVVCSTYLTWDKSQRLIASTDLGKVLREWGWRDEQNLIHFWLMLDSLIKVLAHMTFALTCYCNHCSTKKNLQFDQIAFQRILISLCLLNSLLGPRKNDKVYIAGFKVKIKNKRWSEMHLTGDLVTRLYTVCNERPAFSKQYIVF